MKVTLQELPDNPQQFAVRQNSSVDNFGLKLSRITDSLKKKYEIEDDGDRETDAEYIQEIDNLFKAMYANWAKEDERFFPKEDRAAMIEIFGTTEQRLTMLGYYINDKGNMYGDDESLVDTNTIVDQFGFPTGDGIKEENFKTYK